MRLHLPVFIALCLLCTVNSNAQQHKKSKGTDYKKIGSPMPQLRIVTLGGKAITNKTVVSKANLFVMLFNPLCDHCRSETEMLEKNVHLFKQSKVVMFAAPAMGDQLAAFEKDTHISQYTDKIQIGLDSNGTMEKIFLYRSLPQINIYNKNRKLIKIFTGDAPIDSLKRYIQ